MKYYNYSNNIQNSFEYLETSVIKLPIAANSFLYIICTYCPSGNNNSIKSDLQKLFDSMNLQNYDNYYLLAGDLNCKHNDWGNIVNNSKGNSLKEWLGDNEIDFICRLYASVDPSYPRTITG